MINAVGLVVIVKDSPKIETIYKPGCLLCSQTSDPAWARQSSSRAIPFFFALFSWTPGRREDVFCQILILY